MRRAFQMMCLTATVAAFASAQATASPSYSLVSQDRSISVSTNTGPTSGSDSTVAPDTGLFDEELHLSSTWVDPNPIPQDGPYAAAADAWQESTIEPTVLTADLRADAILQSDLGSGHAASLFEVVFDIPVTRPATLVVDLAVLAYESPAEARVELSGVDVFVLKLEVSDFGSDTFNITRDYDLAPGQYTFSVKAASDAIGGGASARSDAYAQLTITPEPATISLMLAAGLPALLKRKRRSR